MPAVCIAAIDKGVDTVRLALRRAARQYRRASGDLAILISDLTTILPRLVRRAGRRREQGQHQGQEKATPEHLILIQNAWAKAARRILSTRRGWLRRNVPAQPATSMKPLPRLGKWHAHNHLQFFGLFECARPMSDLA